MLATTTGGLCLNYYMLLEQHSRVILRPPKHSQESSVANVADTVQHLRSRGVLHVLGRHYMWCQRLE
jgi:hypothetical protein